MAVAARLDRVLRAYLGGHRMLAAEAVAAGHVEVTDTVAFLDARKADLTEALARQQARIAADLVVGRPGEFALTDEVWEPLEALADHGTESALAELESMGVDQVAAFADRGDLRRRLGTHLVSFNARLAVVVDRMEGDLDRLPADVAITRATAVLERVPGVRDAASRIVAPAFTSGLADVYEVHADAFGGWQYTAVLDRRTCQSCAPLDGTVYGTLAEMYEMLPNFGGNPSCLGGARCRCRGVPLPPGRAAPGVAEPEPVMPWPPWDSPL